MNESKAGGKYIQICFSWNVKLKINYYALVIGAIQRDPKRTVIRKANAWMQICKNPIINPQMLKSNGPHDLTVGISIVTASERYKKHDNIDLG